MKSIILTILSLWCTLAHAQTIITVDNNPLSNADFDNLQQAIDEATPGDLIYIQPSTTSYGQVQMDKTLHLRGLAHYPETTNGVPSEIETIVLMENTETDTSPTGSSFSGLKIKSLEEKTGESFHNIHVANCHLGRIYSGFSTDGGSGWVVEGNVFVRATTQATTLIDVSFGLNWIIHHNIFEENNSGTSYYPINGYNQTTRSFNNIYISYGRIGRNVNNFTFVNDIFLMINASGGLIYHDSEGVTYQNCLLYSYGEQTLSPVAGSDNVVDLEPNFIHLKDESPLFSYENDYRLAENSPGKGAGTDGQDLGIHNGSYNFLMRGYAFDLPYVQSIEIKNQGVKVGETLEVEFKASGN